MEQNNYFLYLEDYIDKHPTFMVDFLSREHPQLIALIGQYISSKHMSIILKKINPDLRTEILVRIAKTDKVSAEIIKTIDKILIKQLKILDSMINFNLEDRFNKVSEILKLTETDEVKDTIKEIQKIDENLSQQIINEINKDNPQLLI